jgi:hypothetical protein
LCGFVKSRCNSPPAFQPGEAGLDTPSGFIEFFIDWVFDLGIFAVGNAIMNTGSLDGFPNDLADIATIGQDVLEFVVIAGMDQERSHAHVMGVAAGQGEGNRFSGSVADKMELTRPTAARSTEGRTPSRIGVRDKLF